MAGLFLSPLSPFPFILPASWNEEVLAGATSALWVMRWPWEWKPCQAEQQVRRRVGPCGHWASMSPELHTHGLFLWERNTFLPHFTGLSGHYSQSNMVLTDVQIFHLLLKSWKIFHPWALFVTWPQLTRADKDALDEAGGSPNCDPPTHYGLHTQPPSLCFLPEHICLRQRLQPLLQIVLPTVFMSFPGVISI